jgi:hypothetical protein
VQETASDYCQTMETMGSKPLVVGGWILGVLSAVVYFALCGFAIYIGLHPHLADVYTGRSGEPGWQAPVAAMVLMLPLAAAVLWLAADSTIPRPARRRWIIALLLFNVGASIVFLLTRRFRPVGDHPLA